MTPRYNPGVSQPWWFRWFPALLLMLVIFLLSARPSDGLPDFGSWDYAVKKGGHMLEYGMLALAFQHGLGPRAVRRRTAWAMAVGYAITDELHQAFVPGRHPSPVDVLVFDNLGAILGLLTRDLLRRATGAAD
jgi:VanZ family protein